MQHLPQNQPSYFKIFLIQLALLYIAVPSFAQIDTNSLRETWSTFREKYPLHAQLIVKGSVDSEGYQTIIISEPPPKITLQGITKYFGKQADCIFTMDQPLGYDGFVTDVIIRLAPNSN